MGDNLNKVQFTTDADRHEVILPVTCAFVLEKNIETGRYDIIVKDFDNFKNGDTLTYIASGDTIEECFLTFANDCPKMNRFIDLN